MNADEVWEMLGHAVVNFWMCPVEAHSLHQEGTPIVEWRGNVAYCLFPGCKNHS